MSRYHVFRVFLLWPCPTEILGPLCAQRETVVCFPACESSDHPDTGDRGESGAAPVVLFSFCPKSDGLQPASDASDGFQPKNDGLQPASDASDGLQPKSDGLQPKSDGLQPKKRWPPTCKRWPPTCKRCERWLPTQERWPPTCERCPPT